MSGFSIDDVRDSLTADVNRFLGRIQEAVRGLLGKRDLTAADGMPGATPFRTIAEHGHALYGTAALVSANSLSTSARLIEQLAERGEVEMGLAVAHLASARRIANAVAAGVEEMRAMLALELDHQGEGAATMGAGWVRLARKLVEQKRDGESSAPDQLARGTLDLEPHELPLPPPRVFAASSIPTPPLVSAAGGDGEAFNFEDEPTGIGLTTVGDSELEIDDAEFRVLEDEDAFSFEAIDAEAGADPELVAVFRTEAREILATLRGRLRALAADPADLSTPRELERIYHTLKGASATVGLAAVSERAAALQEKMEAIFERGTVLDAGEIATIVAETDELRRAAGLEVVDAAARRSRPPLAEARDAFVAEARVAHAVAERLLAELDGPGAAERAGAITAELARLFHRLKGSALLVEEAGVADEAAALEARCAAKAVEVAELRRGLDRLATRLGVGQSESSSLAAADEIRAVFVAEARRIVASAGQALGRLVAGTQGGGDPEDARAELARLLHRLSGSALVVADEAVAFEARTLLEAISGSGSTAAASSSLLGDGLARLASLLGASGAGVGAVPPSVAPAVVRETVPVIDPELWQAFSVECSELLEGLDRTILALEDADRPKEQLAAVLRGYHTLKGVVSTIGLRPTGALVHRVEDLLGVLLEAAILPPLKAVTSFLLQVQGDVRKNLRQARHGYVETAPHIVERRIAGLMAGRTRTISGGGESREGSELAHGSEGSTHGSVTGGPDKKVIRVGIERLDNLMNLAGELVVSRSRLVARVGTLRSLQTELGRGHKRLGELVEEFREEHEFAKLDGRMQAAGAGWGQFSELELDRYEDVNLLSRRLAEATHDFDEVHAQLTHGMASLTDDSDAFGQIVAGIQTEVTRARMVPLEVLMSRLRLPIRDALQRENRDARVVTRGEDVHLDKAIADALFQPMLHLVRNAVSHGLETPERRIEAGKPPIGTITMAARQELGQVVLEVSDDGPGLDLPRIQARAVAMGLLPASAEATPAELRELIFSPGLSTHAVAGAVAGRGVGLDVVRRTVERMNGSIRVDSEPGQGTALIVTLPITLAITKALLVRQGGQLFAVPLYFAERIIEADERTVVESAGLRRVEVNGAFMPVRPLGELLGAGVTPATGPVLVLRVGEQCATVQVDAVLTQEEIVVKRMGALLAGHPMFAGISIRGTGDLVLILDVPTLVEQSSLHADRPAARREAAAATATVGAAALEPAPTPQGDGPIPTTVVTEATQPNAGPLRVLFVDDSVSVRKVAERTLAAMGIDVVLAVDGIDALAKLREHEFDVVLTDLEMPRMHGYELIRELRFLPAYRELPVIVVTSRSGKKHQDEARALGATEYLTKPFTAQSLGAALGQWGGPRAAPLRAAGPASDAESRS